MKLNQDQIAEFHQEGYLVVTDLFDNADLEPVIDEINEAVDKNARELVARGELSRAYEEEGFETRLSRITAETEQVYLAIKAGQLAGPGIFSLLTNPKLLDMVESLVGPEIIASSVYRIRPKVPGLVQGVVPWHQDSAFFEPYCDQSLILTIWAPLVDATPERGCLQVIPRAHRGEIAKHHWCAPPIGHFLEIAPADLPGEQAVPVPVPKGGALVMTNRTPHCSTENSTDIIRWSMDLRYQSARLPTNYQLSDGQRFRPAAEAEPDACYPPEADFLVRSRQRPQDVVTDWRYFNQLRNTHVRVPVTERWVADH